ncbi:MAG: Fe-S cluster assembly ATP-binding protein [Candidatus Midichloriaceae bacterium]|jgi:Fe-S cluster assembly ATP-binding protein
MLLDISKLKASIKDKVVIDDLNLKVKKGEMHIIMGHNGAGKSSFANVIAGKGDYKILEGEILYNGKKINDLEVDERANLGIFLSFQNPIEIPGVSWKSFLKAAISSKNKAKGDDKDIDAVKFLKTLKEKAKLLNIDEKLLNRSVNQGFSGGEKKKFEILQMMLLDPELIILDEVDSGLDIDAMKLVSSCISSYRNKENGFILITHYTKMLQYLSPDYVHILCNGKIVKSGDINLAHQIELEGYDKLLD